MIMANVIDVGLTAVSVSIMRNMQSFRKDTLVGNGQN